MDSMDSDDELDHDLISMEMLENTRDGSQSHENVNLRKSRLKKRDHIRQRQS